MSSESTNCEDCSSAILSSATFAPDASPILFALSLAPKRPPAISPPIAPTVAPIAAPTPGIGITVCPIKAPAIAPVPAPAAAYPPIFLISLLA